MLDSQISQQLQMVWEAGAQHDLRMVEHQDQWLNITPDTGKFLYQIVRASGARRLLEIGTSNGYSTMWLALASGLGHLTSIDISADRQRLALENLQSINAENEVSLICAEAGTWLNALETSPVDFLFLDSDRTAYVSWWGSIQRVLRPGGLVVMDNALSHADECAAFIAEVQATDGYLAETYPIGKGLFIILKDE